jgi:hypothetical protein
MRELSDHRRETRHGLKDLAHAAGLREAVRNRERQDGS